MPRFPCAWLCLAAFGLIQSRTAFAVEPVPAATGKLVISEILYYPPRPSTAEANAGFFDQNDFEFVELYNRSDETLDLSGAAFNQGINVELDGLLEPKGFVLVVRNLVAFRFRYGDEAPVAGQYTGRLANEGEEIVLTDSSGNPIHVVDYGVGGSWPPLPTFSSGGYSLELLSPDTNQDISAAQSWQRSYEPEGTPGRSLDEDGDGLVDGWERLYFDHTGARPEEDPDQDVLSNAEEQIRGTHPLRADTDEDGLPDGVESGTGVYVSADDTGTNPLRIDTDSDGLVDGVETNTGTFVNAADTGTSPLDWDTDQDGYGDGTEVQSGKDPHDPNSVPVVPTILRFESDAASVTVGDSFSLYWESADADGIYLNQGIGPVMNPAGDLTLTPGAVGSYDYVLVASNGFRSVSRGLRVEVLPDGPPIIHEFLATPTEVGRGGKTLLRWSLGNIVDRVRIDPGIGDNSDSSVIVAPLTARVLVPRHSPWHYLDDGSDQGTQWTEPEFDDRHWAVGPGPLGYGNEGLATFINTGETSAGKNITAYFRKRFIATNVAAIARAEIHLMRDDGAQVFLNGQEVLRDLLPDSPIDYLTLATAHAEDDGRDFNKFPLAPGFLREGTNVLAVGVHQASPLSADTQFDFGLTAEYAGDAQPVTFTLTAHNGAGTSTAEVTVLVRRDVEELVSYVSQWRYEDSGADLGSAWLDPDYDDRDWAAGPGILGVESAEPLASLMHTPLRLPQDHGSVLTYLRTTFELPVPPARVRSLSLTHFVDDAAVVYLNGQEAHRVGIEPGQEVASRIVGDTGEEGPFELPRGALVEGTNVLAVALYQPYISTSDIVWGARLLARIDAPASGPVLFLTRVETGLRLSWLDPAFELESAADPSGPWEAIPTAGESHDVTSPDGARFFRLRQRP